MILLGLTGSIGMGKSTTAGFFADLGVSIWDADAAVHRIYGPGGTGAAALRDLVPDAIESTPEGALVSRDMLRSAIQNDPTLLKAIEARVHPLVAADRASFLDTSRAQGDPIALFDIPLLYETGAEAWLDKVLVVTAPADVQRERVLARPGMTESTLETILARQMPDADKRARADYVIDTSRGFDVARADVAEIVKDLIGERSDA